MAQPKVFVSHSSDDTPFATKLVADLCAAGAHAWLDTNDLGAGNFQERISAALDECDWFVLVLTRNALASTWVRQETHAANALVHSGEIKNMIFIKAGPVKLNELPALWRVYNIYDATAEDKYRDTLNRVLKDVGLQPAPAAKGTSPATADASVYPELAIEDARQKVIILQLPGGIGLVDGTWVPMRRWTRKWNVGDIVRRGGRPALPGGQPLMLTQIGVICAGYGEDVQVSWYYKDERHRHRWQKPEVVPRDELKWFWVLVYGLIGRNAPRQE
jgi:hypothetical protein